MKKLLIIAALCMATGTMLHAQSVYQVTFAFPNAGDSNIYNAIFVKHDNGKGIMRIKFRSPASDSSLVELEATEDFKEDNSNCDKDRLFYKLQNVRYIDGADRNTRFPQYFCFKKDTATELFEPFGVSSAGDECTNAVVQFRSVSFIEPQDLTAGFVLGYFKVHEKFYRNLFVTNNSRALTVSEQNVNLILLVVANVYDTAIGPACRNDMNNAINFFKKISGFIGIKFRYDTIAGNNYYIKNVKEAIANLNPKPNDIVVFYYTGHGFRIEKDNRQAPYIDLRHKVDRSFKLADNSLSMEDIFAMVTKEGARLNLVLADCCNSLLESKNAKADAPAKTKGFEMNWSTENSRELFLNSKPASILATAALPGQLATCNNTFGGFFSYFFRASVENHFSFFKNKVTWEQVFEETKRQTKYKADHTYCKLPDNPKNICNQSPYIDIRPGRF
jgi:hypothetical protein